MDDTINIYCYVYAGGKLVQQNDGLWKYIGGRSKGIHVYKGMSYAEFTSRILEKFDISMELAKMHYILKLEKLSPLCVLDLVHVILFIELNYCCFIYLLWSDIMMLLGLLMYLNS